MNTYGNLIDKSTLRMERLLPGPIDRVWAYLTESEKRAKWLAAGTMATEVGGTVSLLFKHENLTPFEDDLPPNYNPCGEGHSMQGTIIVYDEPSRLTYTWGEDDNSESEVTFELSEEGDKVKLVLTHKRLASIEEINSVAPGWHTHLDILAANLADKTPKRFWKTYYRLREDYIKRLAG